MKKDKVIPLRVNKIELEKIDILCEKYNMNRSQLLLYLVDLIYINSIKEDDNNGR